MLLMLRLVLALFVRVMIFAALAEPTTTLPKLRSDDDTETAVPTPVKLTVCGLLESPSTSVRVPVRVPVALGVKVTVMVHDGLLLPGT
jgi:hypothetical protein